ncbi:MAG: hypothetical protein GX662_09695, partial [Trichococcus flocculiformis]
IGDLLSKEMRNGKYRDENFITYFFFCIRNMSIDETAIVEWLSQINGVEQDDYLHLITEMVNTETQHEAIVESRISSLIISLKEIRELNWEEAFRNVSKLEETLASDPAGVYSQTDENTRGRYRLVAEKLATHYRLRESTVAKKALELATTVHEDPLLTQANHVGTYLVGNGYSKLLDVLKHRPIRPLKPQNHTKNLRSILYMIGIFTISSILLLCVYTVAWTYFSQNPWMATVLLIALGILSVGVAVHLINTVFTRLIHPLPQLAMDFSQEIPDDYRTFVVMPVILGNVRSGRTYAERLEKFYLANKMSNLYFAILGDLGDADSKTLPEDEAILEAATVAVKQMNEKYPGEYVRFSLFLRERKWNEREKCWMCWERKRGKLEELNAMLVGEEPSFEVRFGSPEMFSSFRYVITLDADTDMIRETAAQLVGIMAHPLNHPVIDEKTSRITSGYAIVQSEICSRVTDSKASFFTRLFTGETGIDTYATLVSDVYQDTFDEGIFVGKGIYDFRVMHRLLYGMISKNTVLSHDLLESSLTRCAFASGIRMLDTTPPNVAAFAKRDHRWIRGDWQLIPWIFSPSRINLLSRWKMLDNLRRSLTPVASVVSILITAFFFPHLAWIWLPFVLFSDAWRFSVRMIGLLYQKLQNSSLRVASKILFEQISTMMAQTSFNLILLPFNAYISLDAVFRTMFRVFVSHRRLLEWQTSEASEKTQQNTLGSYIKLMLPSSLVPAGLFVATILFGKFPFAIFQFLLATIWLAAPVISYL